MQFYCIKRFKVTNDIDNKVKREIDGKLLLY